jgi:hypothetical protein
VTATNDQVDAICTLVEARIDAAPAATARRLLRPQLRWVEQRLETLAGEELARSYGVLDLIESCRNERLAALDADEGLTVLGIGWQEIVARLVRRAGQQPAARQCPRCGGPMVERWLEQTRRRRRRTTRFRPLPDSREHRAHRCTACGLVAY